MINVALIKNRQESLCDSSESLALGYLAGFLKAKESCFTFFKNPQEFKSASNDRNQKQFDIIGFSIPDASTILPATKAIKDFRKIEPAAHITVGGNAATFNYQEILECCGEIDSVVLQEGEETLCELAESIRLKRDWRQIEGIAYRKNGNVIANNLRPMIEDLDSIPFPVRNHLDVNSRTALPIITSRGCFYNCGFCSVRSFYSVNGCSTWRRRSAGNVVAEIKELNQRYGADSFIFVDDLFIGPPAVSKDYISDFANEIKENKLRIVFTASASIEGIDRDLLETLKRVGLRQIFVGAESASQEILNYLNKKTTPSKIATAIETLLDLDIDPAVSFINFTPVTTIKHLKENTAFFKSFGINILPGLLNRYQVFKGTPLFDKLSNESRIRGQFPNYEYIELDKRVGLVFSICRETLGPFVAISNEISRLGRKIRRLELDCKSSDLVLEIRKRYGKLIFLVASEASEIFEEILKFAEYTSPEIASAEYDKFKLKIAGEAGNAYRGWSSMLEMYESFAWGIIST